eukprot:8514340-Alexandrium_andersonii.AAC.1
MLTRIGNPMLALSSAPCMDCIRTDFHGGVPTPSRSTPNIFPTCPVSPPPREVRFGFRQVGG